MSPLSPFQGFGGGKRVRTADPLLAGQVLYQLSYTPNIVHKILLSQNFREIIVKIILTSAKHDVFAHLDLTK